MNASDNDDGPTLDTLLRAWGVINPAETEIAHFNEVAERQRAKGKELLARELALDDGWTWDKCEPRIQQSYMDSAETILEALGRAGFCLIKTQVPETPHECAGTDTPNV